jgi:hypothetical protein
MNHNKTFESKSIFDKHSDIEIAMDLLSKYYLIQDSILIRFQQKAKEQLFQTAKDLIYTITHPVARRLLMAIIKI